MRRLKAKAEKLWNRAQILVSRKGECSKLSFLKYYCISIINCFTLVFHGFDFKPFSRSKQ